MKIELAYVEGSARISPRKREEENMPPEEVVIVDVEEENFRLDVEDLGSFSIRKLKSIKKYDLLHEQAKRRMQQIIGVSVFCLILDIVLFFVAPYLVVLLSGADIAFSPIPFGATISICGMQAAWISALFYQYRQDSTKADYVFRGKEAFPRQPEMG